MTTDPREVLAALRAEWREARREPSTADRDERLEEIEGTAAALHLLHEEGVIE